MLVGNKLDLASESLVDLGLPPPTPSSVDSASTMATGMASSSAAPASIGSKSGERVASIGGATRQRATVAPEGREITSADASRWASTAGIPVVTEASALSGEGVEEIFGRLARIILTKIELGEIDPDDPMSGIQYGDGGGWNTASDGGSIRSSRTGATMDNAVGSIRARRKPKNKTQNWGLRDWEEVFTLTSSRRRAGGCC